VLTCCRKSIVRERQAKSQRDPSDNTDAIRNLPVDYNKRTALCVDLAGVRSS
jgi:hypothetical protein